jgi:GntR family transcriptional regulator/MocR family aminotransferase
VLVGQRRLPLAITRQPELWQIVVLPRARLSATRWYHYTMSRNPRGVFLPAISLERASPLPLYKQLYEAVRQAILRGTLTKGLRLPSTRYLAAELRVSRNIVVIAFEQLLAEGYIESKTGAGTFVTKTLPDEVLQIQSHPVGGTRRLSERGTTIRKLSPFVPAVSPKLRYAPFRYGLPALNELPLELWGRLLARHCRNASAEIAVHGDPAGLRRLREAIASYVGVARGVRCHADQVIIVNGSQQAIDIAARLLADPGDVAIIEDPGYIGARSVLQAAGIKLMPVKVGREGLRVELLSKRRLKAKLVYVTPSHQFPLGVVLSLANRLELLDWAAQNGAWILEDDFDSEYRYESKPIPALQGLDQNGRVLYIGTFSKVLFPSLRLGYLIVPEDLLDSFVAARWISDRCSPLVEQAALADFISEGHFASHIRRMRALYMERRSVMIKAIREQLADLLETWDTEAGMHTVGWLPSHVDDSRVSAEAAEAGLNVGPVSGFALRPLSRGGLLLGYAAFTPDAIRKGVRDLELVIKKCARAPRQKSRRRDDKTAE